MTSKIKKFKNKIKIQKLLKLMILEFLVLDFNLYLKTRTIKKNNN